VAALHYLDKISVKPCILKKGLFGIEQLMLLFAAQEVLN